MDATHPRLPPSRASLASSNAHCGQAEDQPPFWSLYCAAKSPVACRPANFRAYVRFYVDRANALEGNEVTKVAHYYLSVNAMTKPMELREDPASYRGDS